MEKRTNLIYVDTNVYVALFLGQDNDLAHSDITSKSRDKRDYEKAVKIMTNLNGNKIVISNLIYIEILSMLRKILYRNLDNDQENEVNKKYNKIVSGIIKSSNFKLATKNTTFCNILSSSIAILQKTRGQIFTYSYCKMCNTKHNTPFKSYKSININDIFHLLLAKENNCEKFITFDTSYPISLLEVLDLNQKVVRHSLHQQLPCVL